jgi:hypothetical protein
VARGALADEILRTIREQDKDDSRLVLAQQALLAYVNRHLSQDPRWDVAARALERLPDETPSVRRLAEYHAYRAVVLARTEESDTDVRQAVDEALRLGLAEATQEWLARQLEAAGSAVPVPR